VRKALLAAIAVALLVAPLAVSAIVDRVQVGVSGRNATLGFSPALYVDVTAPSAYGTRGCCYDGDSGEWVGPRYTASGKPDFGGDSTISWGVGFDRKSPSPEAAARGSLTFKDWRDTGSGTIAVPHVVAGREVGTIPAFYVIVVSPQGAAREAGVGVPLTHGLYATPGFSLLKPLSDSIPPYGQYQVNGMLASAWNEQQAELAVRAVRVEGSLPPARVTARRSGARIVGAVRDGYGQPVAGARVRCGKAGTTSRAAGTYSLAAGRGKSCRVVATLGGFSASSPRVRAA
jgi:hypothetical protein